MSKEIDLIKCIISEIDNNLYSDFGGNPCISYTSNLKKLLLALDTPEVRDFFENYKQQSQRITELEEQLKNAIVPKFGVGETVYVYWNGEIRKCEVAEIIYNSRVYYSKNLIVYLLESYGVYEDGDLDDGVFGDEDIFSTKEEAEERLKELGENK